MQFGHLLRIFFYHYRSSVRRRSHKAVIQNRTPNERNRSYNYFSRLSVSLLLDNRPLWSIWILILQPLPRTSIATKSSSLLIRHSNNLLLNKLSNSTTRLCRFYRVIRLGTFVCSSLAFTRFQQNWNGTLSNHHVVKNIRSPVLHLRFTLQFRRRHSEASRTKLRDSTNCE